MSNVPFKSQKSKLILKEREKEVLEKISRSRSENQHKIDRANIMLKYSEGMNISGITKALSANRVRVEKQINKALEFGAIPSLNDLPRSGRPAKITSEARMWLVSLACAKPIEYGYQNELWTVETLAEYARNNCENAGFPCLSRIAKGTVSKILSGNDIKPHKIQYYLERRDPSYEEKMADVLLVYKEVESNIDDTGNITAFISYDEKPGLQALENTAPDLQPIQGKHSCISRDHEYVRHGTLSLLAGIDLTTGRITASVEERHRSLEFVEFLKKLDKVYFDKQKIKVILDNHSAHTSKETMAYLSTKPNRFEFVFTPKHASWLNLIEVFFSKLARTLLRGIRVKSKEALRQRILTHIEYLNNSPVIFKWKYKMDTDY